MQRRLFTSLLAASCVGLPGRAWSAEPQHRLSEFYTDGTTFSRLAEGLVGERIELTGFMAPLLKANSTFFVLTTYPVPVCPFCAEEGDWPSDIAAIYCQRPVREVSYHIPILARGRLEIGPVTDPETGFVSMLRLADAAFERDA